MDAVYVSEVILDEAPPLVTINGLQIRDPQLYDALSGLDDDERRDFVERAVCVGASVIQMMDTTHRVDYVRKEFDRIRDEFCAEMERAFSDDGTVSRKFSEFFGEKGELARMLDDHFGEEGSIIYRLLNPMDPTTPLGRFTEQLRNELDADREGTAFYDLKRCMEEGFRGLERELSASEARLEERDRSPAKGLDFQRYVYESLDAMARDLEDTVEYVGDESGPQGKVGDIVVRINSRDTQGLDRSIVFEAKKAGISLSGRKSFLLELDMAMENRLSHYAVGAVHESNAPRSVGALRRYDGSKIICSVPDEDYPLSLEVAYKMARSELILEACREEAEIDPGKVLGKIREIEAHLEKTRAIRSSLSGAESNIDRARDGLREMEDAIKEALRDLNDLL